MTPPGKALLTAKNLRTVAAFVILSVCISATAQEKAGERRGELGIEVGVRRVDTDITPVDSNGLGFAWGVEGAWAFSQKWAGFADLNFSTHDSELFCLHTDACNALTPESFHKVLTFGLDRRFAAGPKEGRWYLSLGTGWLDVEWNGIQIHNGLLSLGFGRRCLWGPLVVRWSLRAQTGILSQTDNQLEGALDTVRMTNVVFLVDVGAGIGARF